MISYLSNNFQVDYKFNIVTIIHIDYCTTNWFGIHNQYYYISVIPKRLYSTYWLAFRITISNMIVNSTMIL